jgi:hypothetical protein
LFQAPLHLTPHAQKQLTPYSNLVEARIPHVGYNALIANNVVPFIVIGS